MKEKYIVTEQGKVYYWLSDYWNEENKTIFFFPGLTADHSMFTSQFEYFQGKYNLIVWDAPCHGKSRPYNKFSFENTSNIILQILDENNIKDIIAVGQSLGGYHIQAFIIRHTEKVKAFIGIGTTPYGKKYYSKFDIFLLKQIDWMSMCFPFNWLKKMAAKQATCTMIGYKNMLDMIALYKKREYCHLMKIAYMAFLEDNRDIELKCPVLITYGEYDKTGKVKQYCEMWRKETNYPFIIIKNAGHNANVDNPIETNQIIESFLEKYVDNL